ncbi:MAG: RidA family protein [Burkholderiaceae bacterium]|jgi:enamine deaminase RidA (YjgF/YER057c/UK114 family)
MVSLGQGPVKRLHVGPRLSETAIHNGVVYLAGQIAENEAPTVYEQTREVLGHVDRLLAEADSDKTLILSAMVFIKDMAQFNEMNRAWDEWVMPGHTPPRATVEARLARETILVEIKIIAAQYT